MADLLEFAADPFVAPSRILAGHPDDELLDFGQHTRATDSLALERPLQGDELLVPAKDRVGRRDRCVLRGQLATEGPASAGEAMEVVIDPSAERNRV